MSTLEELPPELVADAVARAVVEAVHGGGDTEAMVSQALSRVRSELGIDGTRPGAAADTVARMPAVVTAPPGVSRRGAAPRSGVKGARPVVTEADVLDAATNGRGELRLPPGAILTALARDAARDSGIRLVEEG